MHVISDDDLKLFLKSRADRLKVYCSVCADEGWVKGQEKVPLPRFVHRRDHVFCDHCDEYMKMLRPKKRCFDYSLRFTKHGKRLHKKDVTVDMIVDAIDCMIPHCPGCDIPLNKSSACNELHHCGNLSVCNFCLAICDDKHFEECQRWDHDSYCNPCSLESHKQERALLAAEKREASLRVLKTEYRFEEAWKKRCSRPPCQG
jgi:hypothetical protein